MRLPETAHVTRPWRIHEIAPDFRIEDVWELPTPGGPDDFPLLIEGATKMDPTTGHPAVRALFALRWKLGELLGWDDDDDGLGSRVPTLRDRLPDDLRNAESMPTFDAVSFEPLYMTDNEFAAEIANETMHGVLHLGWVPEGEGRYHGQMAVLVKRNGAFGAAYMAAIAPFRHLLVYPMMIREYERMWQARPSAPLKATKEKSWMTQASGS